MTDHSATLDNARLLMDRGWRARREEKYPDAYSDILEAITLLRQAGAHHDLVTALGRLGHIEMDRERWDEARAIYEETIRICRDAGDSLGLAHKTRHLGDVHRHCGRKAEAGACYQEALSLYRNHSDPPTLDYANAIRMVALFKEEIGPLDEARRLWSEARDLYKTVNLQEGVDECSKHLAGLNG